MNEIDQVSDEDYISKSQVKRECDALQKLGEQLLQLKPSELEKITLPEKLAAAVHEGRRLQARGALKRQRQYIGKLMREVDSENIKKQLSLIQHQHDYNIARAKQTERWRDRLLSGDNQVVTELIDAYPDIDRQHINQLVRLSKREQEAGKPPAAARKLYKYLHEISEQQVLASGLSDTGDQENP
jgi:ribosome-associated protein